MGGALANKDNLTKLALRCTDLMGLLAGQLEPQGLEGVAEKPAYRSLMTRFSDHLEARSRLQARKHILRSRHCLPLPSHITGAESRPNAHFLLVLLVLPDSLAVQSVDEYCTRYTGRWFLTRILTSGGDGDDYAQLASALRDLTVSGGACLPGWPLPLCLLYNCFLAPCVSKRSCVLRPCPLGGRHPGCVCGRARDGGVDEGAGGAGGAEV